MAHRALRLQLLALAAASLLLPASTAVHVTPLSTDDASPAVSRGVPRAAEVIHGPCRLGQGHRLLSDVPAYTEADAPAASSSDDADRNARPSSVDAAAENTLMKFPGRVFSTAMIFFLVAFFVLGAVAVLVVLLVKIAGLAATYVADRCASAWRSIAEARKKATRVRPLDADNVA